MFCTNEQKKTLSTMFNQSLWYTNMCTSIFYKKYNMSQFKHQLDLEKTNLALWKQKRKTLKNIKDKTLKTKLLKQHNASKPKQTKFFNNIYRDSLRKYQYIEDRKKDSNIVFMDFEYKKDRNKLPTPNWWEFDPHNRLPRGSIKNFVQNINSSIANYKNSGRDFSVNYKTKKNKIENIYFEDKCYDRKIDKIQSKYCYTKVINGKRKRCSVSFKDIKTQIPIKSFNITHDKTTGRYCLNLSVPVDFYLENDKRLENQKSLPSNSKIISLDPGLRTFMSGYTGDELVYIGDGCCDKIFRWIELLDQEEIDEGMTDDEIEKVYKNRRYIRKKIEDMVTDLHWKTIKYLTSTYKTVIYPDFRTKGMMKKLSRTNKRKISALSFYKFKSRLIYKCKVEKVNLIITDESWTSRTCTKCGNKNKKTTSKDFKCDHCKYEIDRDCNAARNILIKTIGILSGSKPIFTL